MPASDTPSQTIVQAASSPQTVTDAQGRTLGVKTLEPSEDAVKNCPGTPDLTAGLYLVKNGVPFDVAFSLQPHEVNAWSIALGELDGGDFDFATWRWKEKD